MKRRVVVTGIGMISPVGLTRESTWKNLIAGKSGIDTISSFDTSKLQTKIAGEVNDFEPTNYLTPKQARRMDRFCQLAVAATLEATEQAHLNVDQNNCENVSVIIASGIGGLQTLSEQFAVLQTKGPSRISPFLVPMMLADMASGQVSMLLGAKGPNFSTVSACSSSADALGVAFDLVRKGIVDIAVTGGAEAAICPIGVAGFNSCRALSTRNDFPKMASRPFDAQRDGFVLGEGAGVLVIESLESAIDRNCVPIVEMSGYGATADAHHITQPAPNGEGGARAMKQALKDASLKPELIDYINAHGTSTQVNDRYETMAMKAVFDNSIDNIAISSTKSMTGHLLGAAGALEAAICSMAIANWILPPTINLEYPDPDCDLDYTPYLARKGRIKTAMSNSFGFGGHNSSLIFQEFEE